jgi:hypothetical protein
MLKMLFYRVLLYVMPDFVFYSCLKNLSYYLIQQGDAHYGERIVENTLMAKTAWERMAKKVAKQGLMASTLIKLMKAVRNPSVISDIVDVKTLVQHDESLSNTLKNLIMSSSNGNGVLMPIYTQIIGIPEPQAYLKGLAHATKGRLH